MNRLGFIGGSDARQIMDGDWGKLWEIKTGLIQSDDLSQNIAVQMGSFTELFNVLWFEKQYGIQVSTQKKDGKQHEYLLNYNGVPLKGQIDGLINDPDSDPTKHPLSWDILECKHTHDRNNFEQCLRMYMPQIQFYLWISQAQGCYLSVLFGNNRWECQYITKNSDYIAKMQYAIEAFWQCVTENSRPFDDHGEPVSIDKILVDNMVRRDASSDNHFISATHDYLRHVGDAKSFESAKATLKELVGPNEREVYTDQLSIKRDKRGALRFNIINGELT